MSDQIVATSGITSRQPTTFGQRVAKRKFHEATHTQSHCAGSPGFDSFRDLNQSQQRPGLARSKQQPDNHAKSATRKDCRPGIQEYQGIERDAPIPVIPGDEIHGGLVRFSVRLMSRDQEWSGGFPCRRQAGKTNRASDDQNGRRNKQDAW